MSGEEHNTDKITTKTANNTGGNVANCEMGKDPLPMGGIDGGKLMGGWGGGYISRKDPKWM